MTKFPLRHSNHTLEYKSELFFRHHLPTDWIIDKPTDYGIDFKIEIVSNGAVIGHNFSVQLKAHEKIVSRAPVTIVLDRATINLFSARLEPVLMVCFIAERNEAYYAWFEKNTVDLTKINQTFTIRLPGSNVLSTVKWDTMAKYVSSIFCRKFMLNALPEIDFSEIPDEDEKMASAYYIQGGYDIAELLFKKLLKKKTSPAWLNSVAMCQYAQYRYKEALATINSALEIRDLQPFQINKASILAEFGIHSNDKAMILEANAIFKKAAKGLGDACYFYNYANTSARLGDYTVAEQAYKKSLKLNPNYAEAWKNLGQVYADRGHHKKEIECYNKALAINPRLPQALISKGIALIKDYDQFQEGLDLLEMGRQSDPNLFLHHENCYFWYSHAFFELGNNEQGLKYLHKGLNQFPGNPYLLNLKRKYLTNNWKLNATIKEEAKEFFDFRLAIQPNDFLSLEQLCRILITDMDSIGAIHRLRKYTAFFSKCPDEMLADQDLHLLDYLDGLYSYLEYCKYRVQHPIEILVNSATAPPLYQELTELIGLKLFHVSLLFCKEHRTEKNFELRLVKSMLELAVMYYPRTAVHSISASVEDKDMFNKQLAELIIGLPELAMRECGRINGYLTVVLKMNNKKIDAVFDKIDEREAATRIWEDGLRRVQERFHYFPDDK